MSYEVPFILLTFALIVFFILKKCLNQSKLSSLKTTILSITGSLILSPLIYVTLIYSWIAYSSYYPKVSFNSKQWALNIDERYRMSDNLIKKNLLIGKTQTEVITMLGQPTDQTLKENCLTYYLGFVPRFINIDPDVLTVCFKNGLVYEVKQRNT